MRILGIELAYGSDTAGNNLHLYVQQVLAPSARLAELLLLWTPHRAHPIEQVY